MFTCLGFCPIENTNVFFNSGSIIKKQKARLRRQIRFTFRFATIFRFRLRLIFKFELRLKFKFCFKLRFWNQLQSQSEM